MLCVNNYVETKLCLNVFYWKYIESSCNVISNCCSSINTIILVVLFHQNLFLFQIIWLIMVDGNIVENTTCSNDCTHPVQMHSYLTM